MQDAGFRLLEEYANARVASFLRKPSLRLYNELVAQSPDFQQALIEATRTHVFSAETAALKTYKDVAEIFNPRSSAFTRVLRSHVAPSSLCYPFV